MNKLYFSISLLGKVEKGLKRKEKKKKYESLIYWGLTANKQGN